MTLWTRISRLTWLRRCLRGAAVLRLRDFRVCISLGRLKSIEASHSWKNPYGGVVELYAPKAGAHVTRDWDQQFTVRRPAPSKHRQSAVPKFERAPERLDEEKLDDVSAPHRWYDRERAVGRHDEWTHRPPPMIC